MAPYLPLHPQLTSFRPPCLSNCHHSHGQTQTNLGPVHRLWRLRCSHRVYGCICYWEEDAAEAILQTDHEAWSAEILEYGGYDEEVGRRGNSEKGRQWDVTQEQAEEAKVGKIEGSVRTRPCLCLIPAKGCELLTCACDLSF